MIRLALRGGAARAARYQLPLHSPPLTFHGITSKCLDGVPVAVQAINYALGHARSQKTDDSYGQALLVLEQCVTNLRREGDQHDNAAGMILLAMSTLLSERADISGAVEKLQEILNSTSSSMAVKVAAFEALTGLHLELGRDAASLALADKCLQMLRDGEDINSFTLARAKAIRQLVDLVLGDLESEPKYCDLPADECLFGNVALTYGQFLHITGNYSLAKSFYQKALEASSTTDFVQEASLAAANMISEEVLLGAMCSLGQLAMHTGNFQESEDMLTAALAKAEEKFGTKHPKVGIILTCLAVMFRKKAMQDQSSSLIIQEGLYRRAIDVLKAPLLEGEVIDVEVARSDVMALARGGYGEDLCTQHDRKREGEKMRTWAERMWRNRRLSLAQALDLSTDSKAAVVDARISRIL